MNHPAPWKIIGIGAFILVEAILVPSRASAQSLWDKIKQNADQAKQQGQQASQQIPKKPATKPAAAPAASAPPADANAQSAGSDTFGTPDGTAAIAAAVGNVDIVGIKLGMPMQDAVNALKAENMSFKQTVVAQACVSVSAQCSKPATPHETVGISAVAPNESVFISFTPAAPQEVFSVKRQLKLPPTGVDAVVASLNKKYGPESLNSDSAGNPLGSSAGVKSYVWLFDLQGHLAPGDQAAAFVDCADIANVGDNGVGSLGGDNAAISFGTQSHDNIASGPNDDPYPYPGTNHCVAVTAVTAMMQVDANGMANSLAVEIGSFPLLHSALRESWAGFDQQYMSQPGRQQQATPVASAAASRPPIPVPNASSQVAGQPVAQLGGRPPIPTPAASSQSSAQSPVPSSGRAPIPVPGASVTAQQSAAPSDAPVSIDPIKLPDVVGIHLGTTADDAKAILEQHYPNLPIGASGTTGITVKGGATGDNVAVDLTETPDTPVVWHVGRVAGHQHVNRDTLLAALREKYGKETFNGHLALSAQPVSDSQIQMMEWVFDEQGNAVNGAKVISGSVDGCAMAGKASSGAAVTPASFYESAPTAGAQAVKGDCASLVVVGVQFVEATDIIETFYTSAADLGLVHREAKATYAWKQSQAEQKHQQDVEKSKQTKPTL